MSRPSEAPTWRPLTAALAAVFIGALDLTVIATVLPRIIFDLGVNTADVDRYIWIVNGYLLAYLIAIPIMGRVSDLIGRRPAFLLALGVFLAGSLWCAFADRLPELIAGLRALSGKHGVRIVNFGHAGNGNIHVNLLGDTGDPAQREALHRCLEEAFRLVLSLEGTISGEHGVGIEKRDYVGWEIAADTLATMRELKRVFDPKGILNPGKCLPGI